MPFEQFDLVITDDHLEDSLFKKWTAWASITIWLRVKGMLEVAIIADDLPALMPPVFY